MTRPCDCGGVMERVEYPLNDKYRHDWNEWGCKSCGKRIGRWCQQELGVGEVEPAFHSGIGHPRVFNLNDEPDTRKNGDE